MSSQFNSKQIVSSRHGQIYNSGNKSVNYRLGLQEGLGAFGLRATKVVINSTSFFANEYGIPTPGSNLDITFPAAAATLGVASTSVNDTSAGTGARTVLIDGLDSNYDRMTEVITLNGQTKVTTTKSFLRINDATVLTVGSLGWNEGTIYFGDSTQTFTAGVPQTSCYRTIGVTTVGARGVNASMQSTFTVARNYTAVPLNFKVSSDATQDKPLLVRGIVKPFGLPEIIYGNLTFNGAEQFDFDGFTTVPEKSDLIIRTAKKTANQVDVAVVYWEFNTVRTDINQRF